jgi:branched-chain amino acid transport system ATP-binding protein
MSVQPAVPALSLHDVTVRFGGVTALDCVSVDVSEGIITGLIGPNGAGKSTLLAVASGLQPVAGGRLLLDGRDVTGASPQRIVRARIARTFQSPQLVPEIDVRQHVLLSLRMFRKRSWDSQLSSLARGASTADIARCDRLLGQLGLLDVADRGPMELPMGLRRLVEVAQCIGAHPRVMLLDEPSAGLNRAETNALAAVIVRMARELNIGVLLVEHDMELVLEIAERLTVLDFGRMIATGPTSDVRSNSQVQKAYLGT